MSAAYTPFGIPKTLATITASAAHRAKDLLVIRFTSERCTEYAASAGNRIGSIRDERCTEENPDPKVAGETFPDSPAQYNCHKFS